MPCDPCIQDPPSTQTSESARTSPHDPGSCLPAAGPSHLEAFTAAWTRNSDELAARCRSWMSGRRDLAEEAFSRAALIAFQKYPGCDVVLDDRRWLLRLTRNICMDLHREVKRDRVEELVELEEITTPLNPERLYLLNELTACLSLSIRALPARLRAVMEFLLAEKSYREIAQDLAITEVNVRKRVQEARTILRRHLKLYRSGRGRSPLRRAAAGRERAAPPRDSGGHPAAPPRIAALRQARLRLAGGRELDAMLVFFAPTALPSQARLAALRGYVARHPTGWKKRLALARMLAQAGAFEPAAGEYRKALERHPGHLPGWLELGWLLRSAGLAGEAEEVYARAERFALALPAAQHLRGLAASCRRSWQEAVEELRAAAESLPTASLYWTDLGRACLEAGRPQEAVAAGERALETEPGNPVAPSLLREARQAAGRQTP